MKVEEGPGWKLFNCDFREADICADVMITDPPYLGARGKSWESCNVPLHVPYRPADLDLLSAIAGVRVPGWRVVFNDYPGYVEVSRMFRENGLVVPPAPIPWCKPAGAYAPTGSANSPAKSADFIAVARPKRSGFNAQRPGHYVSQSYSPASEIFHTGGKPLSLMRQIVRDYSCPGDCIVDPCAGAATTLLSAVIEGRYAVGFEVDKNTFCKAVKRLMNGYTADMFSGALR